MPAIKPYLLSACVAALVALSCSSNGGDGTGGAGGAESSAGAPSDGGSSGEGDLAEAGASAGGNAPLDAGASGAGGADDTATDAGSDPCDPNPCLNGATCDPSQPAATRCACPPTYQGALCSEDVDECAVANGGCDVLTICVNTPGGFHCGACPDGYSGNGTDGCSDIDECATDNGGCDIHSSCLNTPGGFSCGACPAGYTGTGKDGCTDIDECEILNGLCDPHTRCQNVDGSRTCGPCPAGFTGDGVSGCAGFDVDNDGVPDTIDQCPLTLAGSVVNSKGCAADQLVATRNASTQPYGLTFASSGNLGRAGGLSWSYSAISRAELFDIYWLPLDNLADAPYGISLDGATIDPSETWTFSALDSNLAGGIAVFRNTTHIQLSSALLPTLLSGRLTLSFVDSASAPIPVQLQASFLFPAQLATVGIEVTGNAFTVHALAEVLDGSTWTPYADYYDAAPKAAAGEPTSSFGGSFYDK